MCVCVLLLISDTTRFGATVKQRVDRSCYDIPNLATVFFPGLLGGGGGGTFPP